MPENEGGQDRIRPLQAIADALASIAEEIKLIRKGQRDDVADPEPADA